MKKVTIEVDEEATVTTKKKIYNYPPFFMAGNGNTNKQGQSIDLISTLCSFSKPEQNAFMRLVEQLECIEDSRKKHNVCVVKNKDLNESEQQQFKKAIKSLIDRGLVKRVKKEHYLINPDLIITTKYLEDKIEWDKHE